MCRHLRDNLLICRVRYEFLKGRPYLTNLLSFSGNFTANLDKGKAMVVYYLDFSKAFDLINHQMLLLKMQIFGIGGRICKWVQDFSRNRIFYVRLESDNYDALQVTSGVPQ